MEEKEVKETEEKIDPKKLREAQNKQLRNILIVLGVVILVALIVYYASYTSKNFEYEGLEFTKMKQGDIDFYVTRIPLISPTTGEIVDYYPMTLRNDPRTLEYIEAPEEINYGASRVYMSFQKDMEQCEDNLIAVANFAQFASQAGFNLKGATNDPVYANESGVPYITCGDANRNAGVTVVLLQNGTSLTEETRIRETVNNCYVVDVNKCEIVEALERMMVITAARANEAY